MTNENAGEGLCGCGAIPHPHIHVGGGTVASAPGKSLITVRIIADGIDHSMAVSDAEDVELVTKLLRRALKLSSEPD